MLDYNNHTNMSNIELLHFGNKGKKIDLLQAYEIKKNSLFAPLINQQINLLDSPFLIFRLTVLKRSENHLA